MDASIGHRQRAAAHRRAGAASKLPACCAAAWLLGHPRAYLRAVDKFPYQPGRGYTPPDAPVERFIALLDHLGFANGLVVQGNAHVYDNSVVLDALTRFPARLRGVAITDTRIKPEILRDWHARGMNLKGRAVGEAAGY